jgi:hypothetical protein
MGHTTKPHTGETAMGPCGVKSSDGLRNLWYGMVVTLQEGKGIAHPLNLYKDYRLCDLLANGFFSFIVGKDIRA